jgi:hypothetical protein
MTILTTEGNCRGQLDNCYVVVEVVLVVLRVGDGGTCRDSQCTTFCYITSISTQYDCVSVSTVTNIYS